MEASAGLKDMDDEEFREFCGELFFKLGYGTVERCPEKKGKDIVLHSNDTKVFVECKNKVRSKVGKQIVESLHSQIVTEGALKGIIVTTGGFTKDALQYVADNNIPIELIDGNRLIDLKVKAGFGTSCDAGEQILTFKIPGKEEMTERIARHISSEVQSKPKKPSELIDITSANVSFVPAYMASYRVDATFSTSAGLIHQERGSGKVIINGNSGEYLGDVISDYVSSSYQNSLVPVNDLIQNIENKDRPCFTLPQTRIKESVQEAIAKRHTRTVRYSGKNNQSYSKVCTPGKNQMVIESVTQIYFPEIHAPIKLLRTDHSVRFFDAGTSSPLVIKSSFSSCQRCSSASKRSKVLCNECGKVVCESKGFLGPKGHGTYCTVCSESLCLSCAQYTKFLFLFKKPLCPKCADQKVKEGKKVSKFMA